VRLRHFERFRPHCAVCIALGRDAPALVLHHVERRRPGRAPGDDDDIVEGALVCPAPGCRFEFPILDGVPILLATLRETVAGQISEMRARDDLSDYAASLLGDVTGPGSDFDRARYYLSTYAHSHWGDLDADRPTPRDGTIGALLGRALELLPSPPRGPWLDIGCSVGRATFELAAAGDDLVLGLDTNLSMLRIARSALLDGRVAYPRRRGGIVYDRREHAVAPPAADRVDFWACDATALPFAPGVVAGALSLNVLDCVASPLAHLVELGRVVAAGGDVLLSTPYDWSLAATPLESWIAGHSQRAPHRGDSATELRRLLSADDAARAHTGLAIVDERDDVPWQVYLHERASMLFRAHLVRARRL
jgi:SAM-dependent methyltransferase